MKTRGARDQLLESKALLEQGEQLARSGSWQFCAQTGEVLWSDNLYRIYGVGPGEVDASLAYVYGLIHPDDIDRVERYAKRVSEHDAPPVMEYRIVLPGVGIRHLRSTVGLRVETDGQPLQVLGTVQDITEERRAEREIAAHVAVSETLHEWASIEQGGERLLRSLGQAMSFDAGVLWLPEGDVLTAGFFWTAPTWPAPDLERAVRALRLQRGAGLAGLAWQQQRPVATADLAHDLRFQPQADAVAAGLRGALAVPALHGDEVLAVLGFAAREEPELTDRLMLSLAGIGYEVGQFLGEHRSELSPSPLTRRERQVLQLAARGLPGPKIAEELGISSATVKTHFTHIYEKLGVAGRASATAEALRQGVID
jgi:PAS domain S-box-containing protein